MFCQKTRMDIFNIFGNPAGYLYYRLFPNTFEEPIKLELSKRPYRKNGVSSKPPEKSTQSTTDSTTTDSYPSRKLKKTGHLMPTRIVTGIYESGGTNPQKIQDDWQLLHNRLRNLCFDSFKRIKHQHQDSTAFTVYKELTKNLYEIPDVKRLPRIETTIVVRKISILLLRTLGLLNLAKDTDISFTIASKMPEDSGGISEDIWRKLPRLSLGTTSFNVEHVFNTLIQSGDYGKKCAKFWNSERKIMEQFLEKYGVISGNIPDIAGQLIYTCIYIKLQMQSIGGADIAGYILGTAGDYLDFCRDLEFVARKYPNRVPFDEENFDNELDTNCIEEYAENSTALFTTFPGIAYRGSNGLKVISKCKIAI